MARGLVYDGNRRRNGCLAVVLNDCWPEASHGFDLLELRLEQSVLCTQLLNKTSVRDSGFGPDSRLDLTNRLSTLHFELATSRVELATSHFELATSRVELVGQLLFEPFAGVDEPHYKSGVYDGPGGFGPGRGAGSSPRRPRPKTCRVDQPNPAGVAGGPGSDPVNDAAADQSTDIARFGDTADCRDSFRHRDESLMNRLRFAACHAGESKGFTEAPLDVKNPEATRLPGSLNLLLGSVQASTVPVNVQGVTGLHWGFITASSRWSGPVGPPNRSFRPVNTTLSFAAFLLLGGRDRGLRKLGANPWLSNRLA